MAAWSCHCSTPLQFTFGSYLNSQHVVFVLCREWDGRYLDVNGTRNEWEWEGVEYVRIAFQLTSISNVAEVVWSSSSYSALGLQYIVYNLSLLGLLQLNQTTAVIIIVVL